MCIVARNTGIGRRYRTCSTIVAIMGRSRTAAGHTWECNAPSLLSTLTCCTCHQNRLHLGAWASFSHPAAQALQTNASRQTQLNTQVRSLRSPLSPILALPRLAGVITRFMHSKFTKRASQPQLRHVSPAGKHATAGREIRRELEQFE